MTDDPPRTPLQFLVPSLWGVLLGPGLSYGRKLVEIRDTRGLCLGVHPVETTTGPRLLLIHTRVPQEEDTPGQAQVGALPVGAVLTPAQVAAFVDSLQDWLGAVAP